ncbi:MAG: DinB family protein [Chloroflexota bacterium]|nr:DinB family protein [Chloroflexota bacterium]
MARIAIETVLRQMNAAYRDDPFHALRKNVESVRPGEWDVRPSGWTVEEFGTQPELSICDLVLHVAGAKFMYADRAFGDASLEWADIALPPARDMPAVLAWLDEGHQRLEAGLTALTDDEELAAERLAPWRAPMRRAQLISIIINHDLYHSGEINRQRALIRGTQGWDRGGGAGTGRA